MPSCRPKKQSVFPFFYISSFSVFHNNFLWSVLLSTMNMTSKCSKLKFLRSMKVQTTKNCYSYVFYNTIDSFDFSLRKHPFLLALRRWERFETSPAAKSEEKWMFSQAILTFISAEVSRKIALEKEKNKLRHHHLISIVCLTNRFHVAVRQFSNGRNIFQNSKPLLTMTHNRNCCRDFLQFKHNQVVKNYFCLRFFIFLLCK